MLEIMKQNTIDSHSQFHQNKQPLSPPRYREETELKSSKNKYSTATANLVHTTKAFVHIFLEEDRDKGLTEDVCNPLPEKAIPEHPPHIWENHYQEWLDSAVDPSIISLNVESLDGTMGEDEPIERLCYGVERNKTPAFGGWPKPISDRYRHCIPGGFFVSGVDPLTGTRRQWGQFKPDTPYTYKEHPDGFGIEAKTKTIKYEAPKGVPTEAMFLDVTWKISRRVAKRAGLYKEWKKRAKEAFKISGCTNYKEFLREWSDRYFWKWVLENPQVAIAITEGAKKAGALLTQGIAGISIPGIHNGCPYLKDEYGHKIGLPQLLPDLKLFATKDREVSIIFDNDNKPKTILNVRKATERLGKLFAVSGCKVSVVRWLNCPEKGVDDLISSKGKNYFESVFKGRLSLADYKLEVFLALYPDLTINERYFPESLVFPDEAKLIGLCGLHGTGKTYRLAQEVSRILETGEQRILVITHRKQLSRELCRRFNIDYRTDIRGEELGEGVFGYGLCIDSLHGKAKIMPFDPDHPQWEDAIVIIDEVEQVLWHLLNGGTCQNNRVRILRTLQRLLQNVAQSQKGKIFIADADLCSISINYIEQLIGYKISKFIVKNEFIPNARFCHLFKDQNPGGVIRAAEYNINKGHKIIIHTDGQKYDSKWGTRSQEIYFKKKFPEAKVLRIDSDTVKDKNHPAFRCVDKLNEILIRFDIVICSPVIETGVSIEVDHFNSVYVISHGVQTVDAVCQTMQRVRTDIPRYVWAKSYSPTRIGNGSNDIKSILSSCSKLASVHIALLMKMGITEANDVTFYEENDEVKTFSPSLIAWAKRAVVINNQNYNFADCLISKIERIGYEVSGLKMPDAPMMTVNKEMKNIKETNYNDHKKRVSKSTSIDDKTYQEWKERDDLTEAEEETLKKAEISRKYLTDNVNSDLVEKDDDGWFKKIQLHYYLTHGKPFIADKEKQKLATLKEASDNGELFKPDVCKSTLVTKLFCLEILDIMQFFNPDKVFTHESLKEWFEKINNPMTRFQVKTILGVTIGKELSAIAVAQRILRVLGLKLELFERRRLNPGEEATRIYRGCDINHDGRLAVFDRWFERDSLKQQEQESLVA